MRSAFLVVAASLLAPPGLAGESELATLRGAGIEPTCESIERFFDRIVPTEERRARTQVLAARLADDDYWVRTSAYEELRSLPQPPVDVLERLAKSGDAEVSWRARRLLEAARRDDSTLILTAVLRTVTEREISGLGRVMLAAKEALGAEPLRRDARRALAATATAGDVDALRAASTHDDPNVRCLVLDALARAAADDAVPDLRRAAADASPRVRLAAARALLNLAERDGLATLVDLLESDDPAVRLRASSWLDQVTGRAGSFSAWAPAKERAPAVAAWRAWLATESERAKLVLPILDHPPFLDRMLVSDFTRDQIVELDGRGEERWRRPMTKPFACRGLPNGHRLVAATTEQIIYELDHAGEVAWKSPRLGFFVSGLRRLPNGNTLACGGGQVVELDRDGSAVWRATVNGAMDAERLPNGNTLVASFGTAKLVEVDRAGREVRSVPTETNPYSLSLLPNGNVLVVCFNVHKVIEYDPSGKKVLEIGGLAQAYSATRLPDGRTFVGDRNGLHEFDGAGKKIATYPFGAPTVYVHRY